MHCIILYLSAFLLINFYSKLVLESNIQVCPYIWKITVKYVYDKQLKEKERERNENKISM